MCVHESNHLWSWLALGRSVSIIFAGDARGSSVRVFMWRNNDFASIISVFARACAIAFIINKRKRIRARTLSDP